MKNLLLVLLGLATVGSVLALAWVLGTPAAPDPRVTQLEAELKEARRIIATLKRDLEKRELALASPPRVSASVPDNSSKPQPVAASGKAGLREMLENPQMRAVMDQQQAVQIEMSYARLFQYLGLSEEEREHFKKLLTGRMKAITDASLKLMNPDLTTEQRQALGEDVDRQKTAYDQTIKAFLNNEEDWKTFQQWEGTLPERQQFDMVGRSLFDTSGEPLSAQQEQQLIELTAAVRTSPGQGGNLIGKTNMDPAKVTPELIRQMVSQLEINARAVEERAARFLTPAQLVTLRAYHKQTIEMSKTGYEMSRTLIQGKEP